MLLQCGLWNAADEQKKSLRSEWNNDSAEGGARGRAEAVMSEIE